MRESGKSQIDELDSRHQQYRGRAHDNVGEGGDFSKAGRCKNLKLPHLSFAQPSGIWPEQTQSKGKEEGKKRLAIMTLAGGIRPPSRGRNAKVIPGDEAACLAPSGRSWVPGGAIHRLLCTRPSILDGC